METHTFGGGSGVLTGSRSRGESGGGTRALLPGDPLQLPPPFGTPPTDLRTTALQKYEAIPRRARIQGS